MLSRFKLLTIATAGVLASSAIFASTLSDVLARGKLKCGISTGLAGFATPDQDGVWKGFDVDFCRSVAVAIFNDPNAVEFVTTTGVTRFPALATGEVDVLYRNTTWTISRDTDLGFNFAGINFYDGQGFMVRKSLGVKSAKELSGASVCVQTGTTTELNLADWARVNKIEYTPVMVDNNTQAKQAFVSGRCDVYTTDRSGLVSTKSTLDNPDNYVVLPEVISKEPLGPAVRHGDDQFFDLVKWVLFTQISAEEAGITSANIDKYKNSKDPTVMRMLTMMDMSSTKALGLKMGWGYNVIKTMGNYGEIYNRNLGPDTPLDLARGPNELFIKGGLVYSPPIR